jgi:hypothetical protein
LSPGHLYTEHWNAHAISERPRRYFQATLRPGILTHRRDPRRMPPAAVMLTKAQRWLFVFGGAQGGGRGGRSRSQGIHPRSRRLRGSAAQRSRFAIVTPGADAVGDASFAMTFVTSQPFGQGTMPVRSGERAQA